MFDSPQARFLFPQEICPLDNFPGFIYHYDMALTDISKAKSRFALLGLLSIRPMSGYDIRDFISKGLSHFWNESYGNIYPGLRRLTEEGLVTRKTERGKGSPDRHVYSLTPRGRDVLLEWLQAETEEEPPVRSELLLKTFFGAQLDRMSLKAHIERFAEQQRTRLGRLRSTVVEIEKARMSDPNAFFWQLTVQRGLIVAEARLRWAEETARALNGNACRKGKSSRNETIPNESRPPRSARGRGKANKTTWRKS
ncbi:MAG: PadR family transcriptional regulator [Candidatus Aminicenantales bacterium]